MIMDLRERIAKALGWTVEQTHGFSFAMLREMVRDRAPELAREIGEIIEQGRHITWRDR